MRRLDDLDRETRAMCLGARTQLEPAAAADLRTLVQCGLDWDRLWDLGHRHDVLPLLSRTLPPAAGDAISPVWLERAVRRRHVTLLRNGQMATALERVLDGLAAADVAAMPVKGLVVADQLYGDLAARGAADLDVLVHPADLAASRKVLVELGYRQRPEPTFTALVHEFHDPPWYVGSGPDQVRLELHWNLWADRFFRSDVDGLWERAGTGRFLGRSVPLLSLEDTLLHLAIHRSRSALRLRWNCDVAELVRRHGDTVDWPAVAERADRIGARTATWIVLSMAERFLGAATPPETLERFRIPAAKRELLERTCGGEATFRATPPGDTDQTPHLTLRVFEQDGRGQIARALASSVRRSIRRVLHDVGLRRVRDSVA
ncbi:MAG: hypothetical protein QOF11_2779 [Chloroflexota bacterium]|nr:hypothetical protein [Chloroflexota bacterium]